MNAGRPNHCRERNFSRGGKVAAHEPAIVHGVHVPAAITDGLSRRGVDVLTSWEDGTREAVDSELLRRATELGRILFSRIQDLIRVATDWQRTGQTFTGLLIAHQRGISIDSAIEDLELIVACCSSEELASSIIYRPLRSPDDDAPAR